MHELQTIPKKLKKILAASARIKAIAKKYVGANGFLFMGRQFNFPIALEGALKLKEISTFTPKAIPPRNAARDVLTALVTSIFRVCSSFPAMRCMKKT